MKGQTIAMDEYSMKEKDEKKKYHGCSKWEAEDYARSLEGAADVLSDPKRMKAAQVVFDEKKASLKTLDELKAKVSTLKD